MDYIFKEMYLHKDLLVVGLQGMVYMGSNLGIRLGKDEDDL